MSSTLQNNHGPEERRSRHRFPVEAELYYLLAKDNAIEGAGQGTTVNISSSGILFRAMPPVRAGMDIELSIAWPTRLDGTARMQLRASGRTVRERDNGTAVHILHYEFKTGGAIPEPSIRRSAIPVCPRMPGNAG